MAGKNEIKSFDLLESPLDGTNLIEASAGTGKTYTITALFLRLILERRFSVDQILVVTYTVAATEELRDRIRKKLRETLDAFGRGRSKEPLIDGLLRKIPDKKVAVTLLREALHDFDEAPIFTIHGFCQRMLHENAFESGSLFDTELVTDQRGLEQEVVSDFWRLHFYEAPPEFVSYAQEKKLSRDSFLKLLGKRVAHPDLKIVPDTKPVKLNSLKPFRETFERLKNDWPHSRAEVLERLSDPGLNQSKYKNPSRFLSAMDGCLASAWGTLPLFKEFTKFTPSGLQDGIKKGFTPPRHPFFILCETFEKRAEALKGELDCHILYLKQEIFRYAGRELPARKERQNIQFFEDLLTRLKGSLEKAGGDDLAKAIRTKYRAALIDEFQDTDPVQYAIFRSVFSDRESLLFLIGDPKQAIYSFRGADLFAYMRASKDVKTRYTLTKNWRSEPGLIEAVNCLFSNRRNPFLYDPIPFEHATPPKEKKDPEVLTIDGKPEPPLHLWCVDPGKTGDSEGIMTKEKARVLIPAAVASEICRLIRLGRERKARLAKKDIREADIAVLVRTNKEAALVQEALRSLGIHSVLHTTGNLFDTEEALQMERVLSGIAAPGQERLLKVALATDLIGVSGEELERLTEDEAGWEAWLSRFRDYYDLWEKAGFIRMFRHFMLGEKVRTRLLSLPDGERRLTNILHLSEVLHQEATEQKLGRTGLLKWLASQRDPATPRLEEHQLHLETDARAVRIVTIHKSKGLEYPIVFCPFNWEGSTLRAKEEFTFHDPEEDWRLNLVVDPGENPHRALAEKENLGENMRLLYVSLTRARNRCYLVWGPFNGAETSSLAYLLHPSEGEEDDPVTATGDHFKGLTIEKIRADLESIAKRAKGKIHLSEIPVLSGKERLLKAEESEELQFRAFEGAIDRTRQFASFTSLLSARKTETATSPEQASAESPDHDGAEGGEETSIEQEPSGIFAFPRGAMPGTFLHDIFEHLDFTENDGSSMEELVAGRLMVYGFEMKWLKPICEMTRRVLAVFLLPGGDGFTFSSIPMKDRLSELEFYFPLKSITPKKLREIFSLHSGTEIPADFPDQIGTLNFQPARGFMKGFIDLVFQSGGRFFLVDWKSNLLGLETRDYGPEAMTLEMKKQFYILQYHLYLVALNQYLKRRVPDYDYERHFGGVFYIFLRGVDPETGPEFGVFRDRPRKELIEALCEDLIVPSPVPQA